MSASRMTKGRDRKTFMVTIPVRMGFLPTFYYQDCVSEVGEKETGDLGTISGGLGGVLGVKHKPSDRDCFIWPEDLWEALIPAMEAVPNEDWDDGWEPVPEPTAEDLERADRIRAEAKEKAERESKAAYEKAFGSLPGKAEEREKNYPDSAWGRHSSIEASEVDFTLRADDGVGYTGGDWATFRDKPREVRIGVTSYIGMSPEAIHYYATLHVDGLPSRGPDGRESWRGGSGTPPTADGIQIRIEKLVTRAMMRDGADWEGYKAGDWTYRFETEEGARVAARKFFAERFEGDWELVEDGES